VQALTVPGVTSAREAWAITLVTAPIVNGGVVVAGSSDGPESGNDSP